MRKRDRNNQVEDHALSNQAEEAANEAETVEEAVADALETAEETVETVEDAVETAEETVETVAGAAEETVAETSETVAEVAETAEETAEEIASEAADVEEAVAVEETVTDAADETADATADDATDETASESSESEDGSFSDENRSSEFSEGSSESEETHSESPAEEKDEEEQAKEKSSVYMFFDTLRFIAIGLLVGILLVVFVIQRNDVYGSSMEPTLNSGDAVFVEMISAYTGNFKRGDIVTIDAKGMEGYTHEENLIKRIIGLPGETIKIEDGNVYINGQLLDESAYLPAGTKTYVGAEGQSRGYMEVTLGPDEYYCMGDNRGTSKDSRRLGPFKKKQLEAKVIMRIYPFNKVKFY